MARYRVQGPDGQIHVFEGPDGASPSDIEAFAAKTFTPSTTPKAEKPAAPMAKEDTPGFGETMLIGAGRTFDRVGKGMQQLYYGAKSQIESPTLSSLVLGKTPSQLKLDELKAAADEETRLYKPLKDARPWATGIGESLPSMVIPAGGSATLLGNAMRMGAAGAVPGLLEYGTAGERGMRGAVGAAAGAAAPLAGAAVKAGVSLVEPLWKGGREAIAGRTLNRVAGDSAAGIKARLGAATELVPGSMPTAAEVAESGGIAALQRSASAANPEAYTQRAMEQGTARLNALRGIAKDEPARAAAEATRDAATSGLYETAKKAAVSNSPELSGLLARVPGNVVGTAKRIAQLEGEALNIGPKTTEYSGKALHYIKLALDDAIGSSGQKGVGAVEQRGMVGLKDQLLEQMDTAIPAYQQARQTYAQLSKPVNQMEIGQSLVDKLKPALSDHGALGQESAATFANALRNADQTAAKATGFKNATLANVMEPAQMDTLNAVAADLARKTNAQNLGRGVGSDTFQKLSMQNIAQQSGMPRLVGGALELPGVSRATNWMYRDTDQQLQSLLAEALLNPKAAAELMTKADKRVLEHSPTLRRLIEQSAVRGGGLAGLAGVSSQSQP